MKKNLIVMGAFVFASLILASCGSNGNSGSTELKTEPKKDSVIVKKESVVNTSDFKIKFYLQDNPEGPNGDSTIYEYIDFQKNKEVGILTYQDLFNKIEILGNYENLTIIVYNGSKEIFKKINLSVNGKVVFTKNDFDFKPVNKKKAEYKVVVLEKSKELFAGKVTAEID